MLESRKAQPGPVRLGIASRFWLTLACVDIQRAQKCGNDVWVLTIIGQQIFLIFLVLVGLQGYAFHTISEADWYASFLIAAITASIIISIDRAFLAQDYETEGKFDAEPKKDWKQIATMWGRRILFGAFRAGITFFLSYAFASIALLGLLSDEINSKLQIYERERNSEGYERLADFDEQQQAEVARLNKRQDEIQLQINTENKLLANLRANPPRQPSLAAVQTTDEQRSLSRQREALQAKKLRLESDANRFDACANAERTGLRTDICPEIVPSGVPECKTRCKAFLVKASVARNTAHDVQRQILEISETLARLDQSQRETAENRSAQRESIFLKYVEVHEANVLLQEAKIVASTKELIRAEKSVRDYELASQISRAALRQNLENESLIVDTGWGGLARSLRAYADIMTSELAKPESQHLLEVAKWAIVALELSVIFSRFLTATPTYSRLTYLDAEGRRKPS